MGAFGVQQVQREIRGRRDILLNHSSSSIQAPHPLFCPLLFKILVTRVKTAIWVEYIYPIVCHFRSAQCVQAASQIKAVCWH